MCANRKRPTAKRVSSRSSTAFDCNTLQHTAAHRYTLQHAATRFNTLQHSPRRTSFTRPFVRPVTLTPRHTFREKAMDLDNSRGGVSAAAAAKDAVATADSVAADVCGACVRRRLGLSACARGGCVIGGGGRVEELFEGIQLLTGCYQTRPYRVTSK